MWSINYLLDSIFLLKIEILIKEEKITDKVLTLKFAEFYRLSYIKSVIEYQILTK